MATTQNDASSARSGGLLDMILPVYRSPEAIPGWFFLLFSRIAIAPIFWISGQGKVAGAEGFPWFSIQSGTFFLFREEYQVPLLTPETAAWVTAIAEHVFPALLVLGLFTRFAALSLLIMTLVIQVFVYPGAWWNNHMLWTFPLLFTLARGPGPVSLDYVIEKAALKR